MPRILVADDNSNIHRTVSLALKDAGVEVVAVGNGEAAVRKIAEIKPDLVLADIFMPVRSGYEVCEFVKKDPRFANTPVVLLIGAFDPFDEREAQRVQADGILKKPFVPPDSLLRMVADLLAQSAGRLAPVAVAAGVAKTEREGVAGTAPSMREAESAGYMDAAPEEFTPAKARIEWNAAEQPLAFSSLLESPTAEPEEPVVTAQRDPTLGEPAFWTETAQSDETESEAHDEDEGEDRERAGDRGHSAAGGGFELLSDEIAGPAAVGGIEPPFPGLAGLETLPELPEPAASLNQIAEPQSESPAPPARETLPAIPGFQAPASEAEPASDPIPDLKDFAWAMASHVSNESERAIAAKSMDEPIAPAPPALATLAPLSPAPDSEPQDFDFDPLPAIQASSQVRSILEESGADPSATPVPLPDPATIEAVALRVIERMQPKIIELVTRELLRPVVEALVQRELEKK